MLRKCVGLGLILSAAASIALAQGKPIPRIVKTGTKYTFLVDGKPFLMLGGQVDNFSAWLPGPSFHRVEPIPDEIAKVLPGFKSYHANTIEFPVHWGYIDPKRVSLNSPLSTRSSATFARIVSGRLCFGSARGRAATTRFCPIG